MCSRPFTRFTALFWACPRTSTCPSWTEGATTTQDEDGKGKIVLHSLTQMGKSGQKAGIRAKVIPRSVINTCSVQLPNVVGLCISFPPPLYPDSSPFYLCNAPECLWKVTALVHFPSCLWTIVQKSYCTPECFKTWPQLALSRVSWSF